MTSVNQPPSTKNPSISITKRLEELWKASIKSSGVTCTIEFLDCSEEASEIDSDGDRTDASITKDQMLGIFLTVESIISELKEIRRLVLEHASNEDESCEIIEMIDDALKMIDLASRMGRMHLSNDSESDDKIQLCKIWVNGFFCTLKYAGNRLYWLFEKINTIYLRIEQTVTPDNGGDLVKDALH
ncbi:MAG: hypothetical protein Q8L97_11195 [Nitrosomonas sp.]|uniref:hypothetical protein n=1 Tax=Nitrosomonas sp. TaxID=42353 RepID=UPI00272FCEBA|nr:hypothetical protein [Nitrosomonas sp.]MDP1550700.1 hypothetical protein [Nitrosomonas sp.]